MTVICDVGTIAWMDCTACSERRFITTTPFDTSGVCDSCRDEDDSWIWA